MFYYLLSFPATLTLAFNLVDSVPPQLKSPWTDMWYAMYREQTAGVRLKYRHITIARPCLEVQELAFHLGSTICLDRLLVKREFHGPAYPLSLGSRMKKNNVFCY